MTTALASFHPLIQEWFCESYSQPTDIQERSWPRIADNENVLITAPTGSGKTLTAFLWAINQLVTSTWPTEQTSVLYISPLKALNNDIYRNLSQPLQQIKEVFEKNDEIFPLIRPFVRSGDTTQTDRRRMLRHPPEILITTPESLNLLLSSQSGRGILTTLSTVILDEIHAVVGDKRGVHLITAVDRLVRLSGDFQRISLSATVRPLESVAEFVGGFQIEGGTKSPRYIPRSVSIVQSDIKKEYQIRISFPEKELKKDIEDALWESLADAFKDIILGNRSTLLFANSRKLSEKLAYKINEAANQSLAYAHHGSLSKEIREEVEKKLKAGGLRAIVATSSLEMGIDIGDLDEVVLIQSPPSVSSAIQRIGRAGHHVGEVSKGTIYPSHAIDFICAAVLAESIDRQDIEEITPVPCPLDVLAQVLISMVGVEKWDMDELFAWIRTSFPYRELTRDQFDLVLNMLAGRYAESRIRELKPRISIDRLDNTVEGKKGSLMAVYMSGGTIPNRGYFQLRHQESGARIAELDEEYVWEAKIGQIATIGTQNWKIQRITHNDVFAVPVGTRLMDTPFWKGEEFNRDAHFSEQISDFLEKANQHLNEPEFREELHHRYHMEPHAAQELVQFLNKQVEATESDLPHRHHLLMEYVRSGPDGAPGSQLVMHTLWGGMLNRPYAMALDAAWEEKFDERLEVFPGNDSIILQLAHQMKPEDLLSMVTSATVESLLKKRLEGSGFFGARFRECAGRALLVTRNKISERMPLWMTRLRSQKLLEGVLQYDDFPILLETWRTCLQDEFDLDRLQRRLAEMESGSIGWTITNTSRPSPMAAGMTWNQVDKYMYQLDQPASTTSSLRESLLQDVVFTPGLRPAISQELVDQFEVKRQRLSPGYAPRGASDLVDWVKERIAIPLPEWEKLLEAMARDASSDDQETHFPAYEKLVMIAPKNAAHPLVISLEYLPKIRTVFYDSDLVVTDLDGNMIEGEFNDNGLKSEENGLATASGLLGEWLRFYGPRSASAIAAILGMKDLLLQTALDDLLDGEILIKGKLVEESGNEDLCDSENFEILLRINRAQAIPPFEALSIENLPLFLAYFQGMTKIGDSMEDLFHRLEQLICYSCSAELWESDIFPARLSPYHPSWLDSILQEGDLRWVGKGKQKISFCFQSDLDLLSEDREEKADFQSSLLENREGRHDFVSLQRATGFNSAQLSGKIWEEVWNGLITNDAFAALRKGIENRFQVQNPVEAPALQQNRGRRASRRGGFARWKGSMPYAGNWFSLPKTESPEDLLENEELCKDRVRILLERFGVLFRELLHRELPGFSWSTIFRSLRLMELSGEVLAGYFFEGPPGPQFISHQAFRLLQAGLPADVVYWMNASDPASLCGVNVAGLKSLLPRRSSTTHIVFKGANLVLISERNGRSLTINSEPNDKKLQEYLAPLKNLLYRQFMPLKQVVIETINQEDASRSPYLDSLKTAFEVLVEFKKVTLYRKL